MWGQWIVKGEATVSTVAKVTSKLDLTHPSKLIYDDRDYPKNDHTSELTL